METRLCSCILLGSEYALHIVHIVYITHIVHMTHNVHQVFQGCKRESVDHQNIFARGEVYINGMEGFWGFAKLNVVKHRDASSKKFLLYLKEMEWRYDNRECDLFDLLV